MGRKKLSSKTVKQNYSEYKSQLNKLIEERQNTPHGEKRNEITRKISSLSSRMSYLRKKFPNLFQKNEIEQSSTVLLKQNIKHDIQKVSKSKFQLIEEKANNLLQEAKTEEEKKSIKERLYYCKLRYKYSY